MKGGDRHDRWGQTNTKLSWTQMFCAQKILDPEIFLNPEYLWTQIFSDLNFFYLKFFGLDLF